MFCPKQHTELQSTHFLSCCGYVGVIELKIKHNAWGLGSQNSKMQKQGSGLAIGRAMVPYHYSPATLGCGNGPRCNSLPHSRSVVCVWTDWIMSSLSKCRGRGKRRDVQIGATCLKNAFVYYLCVGVHVSMHMCKPVLLLSLPLLDEIWGRSAPVRLGVGKVRDGVSATSGEPLIEMSI